MSDEKSDDGLVELERNTRSVDLGTLFRANEPRSKAAAPGYSVPCADTHEGYICERWAGHGGAHTDGVGVRWGVGVDLLRETLDEETPPAGHREPTAINPAGIGVSITIGKEPDPSELLQVPLTRAELDVLRLLLGRSEPFEHTDGEAWTRLLAKLTAARSR